jgi:hypothetical protein
MYERKFVFPLRPDGITTHAGRVSLKASVRPGAPEILRNKGEFAMAYLTVGVLYAAIALITRPLVQLPHCLLPLACDRIVKTNRNYCDGNSKRGHRVHFSKALWGLRQEAK